MRNETKETLRKPLYAIVGIVQYTKQAKHLNINLKPTKDCLLDINTHSDILVYHMNDINKLGFYYGAFFNNAISKKKFICVDDHFNLLTDEQKDALIAHEVGHYKLGHHSNKGIKYLWDEFLGKLSLSSDEEKNLLMERGLRSRDYTQEYEADAYAVMHAGKEAVESLLLYLHNAYLGNSEEIIQRYRAITGKDPKGLSATSVFQTLISWGDIKIISIDALEE